jgi:hypothetical protein
MSIVNHDYKHVFIHVPKTAGSSMELLPWVGGSSHQTIYQYRDAPADYYRWAFVRNPMSRFLSAYRSYIDKNRFYRMMGYDPTADEWLSILDAHMCSPCNLVPDRDGFQTMFPKVDADLLHINLGNVWKDAGVGFPLVHFVPQHYFLCVDGEVAVDFVGRYENLAIDFAKVSRRILGRTYALSRANASTRLRAFVDKARIRRLYARDFELWYRPPNYTKDDLAWT